MVVGAVAQVLEDVLFAGERRGADPGQALAAHVGVEVGHRVVEPGHVVAADAGERARAVGQLGRRIVRAARAEERLAGLVGGQADGGDAGGRDAVQIGAGPLHVRAVRQAVVDGQRDFGHRQGAQLRQQRRAAFVDLADDAGPSLRGKVIERRPSLGLDQAALVLDDHQGLEAGGEGAQAQRLQRPRHADLIDGDAQVGGFLQGHAHGREGFQHVLIGLALADDAQTGLADLHMRGAQHHAVDVVGAGEGQGGGELVEPHAPLLLHRLVLQPDAQAAGREREVGDHRVVAAQRDVDGHARVHGVGQGDHARPQTREARHGDAENAVVQHLLHVGRRQHRHLEVLEGEFRLRRQGRALAAVVVAGHRQHAAGRERAREVRMLEDVAGAVDAGRLAVPHAEHAIIKRAGEQIGLLAAPHGGGGEVLVEALLEDHVVRGQQLLDARGLLVEAAQRRAAIARKVAAGVQSREAIEALSIEQNPEKSLHASDEGATIFEHIFVVERDFRVPHGKNFPPGSSRP